MKMKITSPKAAIEKGLVVDIWYFGAFKGRGPLWTFGADDGEATYQITLDDAEVFDGDLTDMVFKQFDWADSSFVLHRALAEDEQLYKGIVDFDEQAYAEFHRRLRLQR